MGACSLLSVLDFSQYQKIPFPDSQQFFPLSQNADCVCRSLAYDATRVLLHLIQDNMAVSFLHAANVYFLKTISTHRHLYGTKHCPVCNTLVFHKNFLQELPQEKLNRFPH